MVVSVLVVHGGNPEDWGIIPSFLNPLDPRPAREQFDERYIGGWYAFPGFVFDQEKLTITYEGDPPYGLISMIEFRDEAILLFPHGWVMILQKDGTWEISRMD